jgi:hypothetical protein
MTEISRNLVRSLQSDLCPACRKKKKRAQTLCGTCYFSLPYPMRKALYARLGNGYEQSFNDAMRHLEVETPAFPEAADVQK